MSTVRGIAITLAAIALLEGAPAAGSGVNISWNDCGNAGDSLAVFACDTNDGTRELVVSFVPEFDMPYFAGVDVALDIGADDVLLPDWWAFVDPASCRPASLEVGFDSEAAGAQSCPAPWTGAIGGIGAYLPGRSGPNTARILAYWATASPAPITAGTEYYAMTIRLRFDRTLGPDSCSGCRVPVAIGVNHITLNQPGHYGPPFWQDLILEQDNDTAGWQCLAVASRRYSAGNWPDLTFTFQCPTPVRRETWGAIKSLYR